MQDEESVEALSPPAVSADVSTLVAHPMDPSLAYAEVLDFLLNRPTPEAGVAFQRDTLLQEDSALEETGDGIWSIDFYDVLLARLEERNFRLYA
jgi:hypothetical protein